MSFLISSLHDLSLIHSGGVAPDQASCRTAPTFPVVSHLARERYGMIYPNAREESLGRLSDLVPRLREGGVLSPFCGDYPSDRSVVKTVDDGDGQD